MNMLKARVDEKKTGKLGKEEHNLRAEGSVKF